MRTVHYVIGDVHGCYDEMMALIKKIESMDSEAQICFVGDFIDRGPKVWETLCWAMDNITENGKYQTVRGNHEQMAIDYINEYNIWYAENVEPWQPHQTEPSSMYDISVVLRNNITGTGNKGYMHPGDFKPYFDFFESLPYSKLLKINTIWGRKVSFRIVHAYYEYGDISEGQQHNSNLWSRAYHGNSKSEEIIVHGHTPTIHFEYICDDESNTKPGMISYRRNDINVDGGCTFAKIFSEYPCMLCAIRLEDLEEIYPCSVEERFAEISEKYNRDFDVKERADDYTREYLEHRLMERERILRLMGHPDYQDDI